MAEVKHSIKQMSILKNGDLLLDSPSLLEQHVVQYYSNLYASENDCVDNGLVEKFIPKLVSNEDNVMVTNILTIKDVRTIVFSLIRSGAPGPNGFGGAFY